MIERLVYIKVPITVASLDNHTKNLDLEKWNVVQQFIRDSEASPERDRKVVRRVVSCYDLIVLLIRKRLKQR